ncbi:MAG: monovalent cation/H(+) antiporter subunit G, partial [Hyphomonadaceae bacterium]
FDVARLACGGALIGAGVVFLMLGALGLLRLPDFYTRLHSLHLLQTIAAPCILLGLAVAAWSGAIALKLLLLGLCYAAFAPALSHALASAAHGAGLAPLAGPRGQGGAR